MSHDGLTPATASSDDAVLDVSSLDSPGSGLPAMPCTTCLLHAEASEALFCSSFSDRLLPLCCLDVFCPCCLSPCPAAPHRTHPCPGTRQFSQPVRHPLAATTPLQPRHPKPYPFPDNPTTNILQPRLLNPTAWLQPRHPQPHVSSPMPAPTSLHSSYHHPWTTSTLHTILSCPKTLQPNSSNPTSS